MMEDEFVRRRQWLTEAEFLDRLAAANLIPGPSSTEVAIFVGHAKRGWLGLIVAGCCFIIPAALIVTAIAWAYARYGSLPQAAGILYAIKPVVVAIILQAIWKFARTGIKSIFFAIVAGLSVVVSFAGVSPIAVLLLAGMVAAIEHGIRHRPVAAAGFLPAIAASSAATVATAMAVPVSLWRLGLSFLKIGSVVFGSGYVLLAFLHAEFIEKLHWLTEKQLIDAIAVGQFTPGPLFTTATFIGYLVAGWKGAVVGTIGIFLPGFLLVAVSGPLIPRLRKSATVSAALDGVIAASIALMVVVTWQLGRAAIVDRVTIVLFVLSAIVLLRFRVNSAWLIGTAGVLGWLWQAWR